MHRIRSFGSSFGEFTKFRQFWVFACILAPAFACVDAKADYAWLPDFQKLHLRVGGEFLDAPSNFNVTGVLEPLRYKGTTGSLQDMVFFIEPEYGIAEDFSVGGRFTALSGVFASDNGGTPATGAGLGDSKAYFKWALRSRYPILTLETFVRMPTGNAGVSSDSEISTGDGSIDVGGKLHLGQKAGRRVLFALSPGLLGRTQGYSSAVTVDAAVQFIHRLGFLRLYIDYIYSFEELALYDSSPAVHDALGSAGSYMRLNGSPVGLSAGAKLAVKTSQTTRVEAAVNRSYFGYQFPQFFSASLGFFVSIDFYEPPTAAPIREIPLDSPEGEPMNPGS